MAYDGATIRRARVLAGLTQKQLGKLVGSERSVIRWEREGVSDRGPWVARLESALRLTDPAVQLAIRDMDSPDDDEDDDEGPPPEVDLVLSGLDDDGLFAILNASVAEMQRRYRERLHSPELHRMYGQPSPYPRHLDSNTPPQEGEGPSHERADETG